MTALPGAPDTRRHTLEALAAGLVVLVAHLLFRLSGEFLTGALNDDGVYVVLGKAIAEGEGYRSIHLVGAPVQVRFPPGLPTLLAVPWALGGTLSAARGLVAVLHPLVTGASASLIWWLGRRRLEVSPVPLAVLALGPLLLDATIQYFNIPLSEPFFVLGWAGALVLAYPLFAPGSPPQPMRAAALGLVLAATYLFRTAGIALLPAVLLALGAHRRWRDLAWCAAALVVPLASWKVVQAVSLARGPVSLYPHDLGQGYLDGLFAHGTAAVVGYLVQGAATNTVEYVGKLASYAFSSQAFGVLVVLAATAGAAITAVRAWRTDTALVLSVAAVLVLTIVWPFAQGRLLLPLLPFIGLLAAAAVEPGIRRVPSRYHWGPPLALGLLVLSAALRQGELREAAARAYHAGGTPRPQDLSPTLTLAARSRFIYLTTSWVAQNTAPNEPILSDAPSSVYVYTGRPSVSAIPPEQWLADAPVFASPGAYVARRILEDSVAVVVYAPPADALERDILTVLDRCPGVMRREPPVFPAFFRVVQRDTTCLRTLVPESSAP